MNSKIKFDKNKIIEFCKKHHITKFAIFGSALSYDFGPDSDIDVLVEFDPVHIPGFSFFGMAEELSQLLGRKVDLNTPKFLSRYIRDQVIKESETLYEAA